MHKLRIKPNGDIMHIHSDDLQFLRTLGSRTVARASNVEPTSTDQWTADLAPVGGPLLGPFTLRSEALSAEVAWLDRNVINPDY